MFFRAIKVKHCDLTKNNMAALNTERFAKIEIPTT